MGGGGGGGGELCVKKAVYVNRDVGLKLDYAHT